MVHTHVSKGLPAAEVLHKSLPKALMMAGALMGLAGTAAWSQPTPPPTTGDLGCKAESAVNPLDTVISSPDAAGFYSLFDGSFNGWFQSCVTAHSGGSTAGAVFRTAKVDGKPAIYSTQRGATTGGVMMTNRKFRNYEIRFKMWPDYGNDGGLFNRTPVNGRCYRTTLSYINGASMGGAWGEGGFTPRDYRPFVFNGAENLIKVPGNSQGEQSNWTLITRKLKAGAQPNLPCPATGCTQADWQKLWDKDGWNDIRIQFYGGTGPNDPIVKMKSWFKKPLATLWVPFIEDLTLEQVIQDNRIGFLVHGGGRFAGPKGTWYKDIRWKPLSNNGKPLTKAAAPPAEELDQETATPLAVSASGISGQSDLDYSIQVVDARGRLLETFSGKAGEIRHGFSTGARGLLFLKVKTGQGTAIHRVVRP